MNWAAWRVGQGVLIERLTRIARRERGLSYDVGLEWAYARIRSLGKLCHKTLSAIDGVSVITPRDRMAGLT